MTTRPDREITHTTTTVRHSRTQPTRPNAVICETVLLFVWPVFGAGSYGQSLSVRTQRDKSKQVCMRSIARPLPSLTACSLVRYNGLDNARLPPITVAALYGTSPAETLGRQLLTPCKMPKQRQWSQFLCSTRHTKGRKLSASRGSATPSPVIG